MSLESWLAFTAASTILLLIPGPTVLLVPGKVSDDKNENYDQVYARSQAEIKKALPLAEELGVKIAIEVVWNDFITKPEQLIAYVDDFKNPAVGAYFDASGVLFATDPVAASSGKLFVDDLTPRTVNEFLAGSPHPARVDLVCFDNDVYEAYRKILNAGV